MEYSKKFLVRLRKELIQDEGCVLSIYEDHLGYKTVGVGHLILPSDPEWGKAVGTRITQTRADELLVKDFNIVLEECEERLTKELDIRNLLNKIRDSYDIVTKL